MNKTLIAFGVVLVAALGLFMVNNRSDDTNKDTETVANTQTSEMTDAESNLDETTQPAENTQRPTDLEEIKLAAVGNYQGNGVATRSSENNSYFHEVIANIADPADGKFYEGWVVTPDLSSIVSTGKMIKEEDNTYTLTFTSEQDLSANVNVVITEETLANGLDGIPEDHVLEGSFSES